MVLSLNSHRAKLKTKLERGLVSHTMIKSNFLTRGIKYTL